jgi:hypothetical protein
LHLDAEESRLGDSDATERPSAKGKTAEKLMSSSRNDSFSNLGLTGSASVLQVEAEESGPANPDGKESQVEEDLLGEVSAKDFLPKLVRPGC